MSLANTHGNSVHSAQEEVQELYQPDLAPPVELTPEELRFWRILVDCKSRNSWSETDLHALADLAKFYVQFENEKRILAEEGHIIQGPKGPMRNPRSAVVSSLRREQMSLHRYLQIDPTQNARPERKLVRGMKEIYNEIDGDEDGLLG